MDLSLLKAVLSTPEFGIASLGVLMLIFRNIIKAKILSKLTQEHSYKVLDRIITFVGVIAMIGALFWGGSAFMKYMNLENKKSRQAATLKHRQNSNVLY